MSLPAIHNEARAAQIDLVRAWAVEVGVPPWVEQTREEQHRFFGLSQGLKMTGPAAEMASVRTMEIATRRGPRSVRLYQSKSAIQDTLLIYVHGGGYVLGNLDAVDSEVRRIADSTGLPIVSISYRLAPEHPFPAGIDDVEDILVQIADGALGFRTRRIGMLGVSAGAGIATAALRRRLLAGHRDISMIALFSPWLDATLSNPSVELYGTGYFQESAQLFSFRQSYVPQGTDHAHPELSPARAPLPDSWPATIILAAELDPLADDSALMSRRVSEGGAPCETRFAKGMLHGFHTWWQRIPAAKADIDWADERLRKWAHGGA
ncbi:acetyl esterase [Rhizobium aquaticum]|uniref:Acetyl esterase n=1 Tax=Rhizobium aquaticum TaxID=1549636 RepID=A0ABV2J6J8_9HYPH